MSSLRTSLAQPWPPPKRRRSVSSWVGDHQRIQNFDCFCHFCGRRQTHFLLSTARSKPGRYNRQALALDGSRNESTLPFFPSYTVENERRMYPRRIQARWCHDCHVMEQPSSCMKYLTGTVERNTQIEVQDAGDFSGGGCSGQFRRSLFLEGDHIVCACSFA